MIFHDYRHLLIVHGVLETMAVMVVKILDRTNGS